MLQNLKTSLFIILSILILSCGDGASEYQRIQQTLIENESDIMKIVANSKPEIGRQMTKYINTCMSSTQTEFLEETGKSKAYLRQFYKAIDGFMTKIDEARNFIPNESDIKVYDKLRSLILRDANVISQYINHDRSKYNHTDLQRVRLYQEIMRHPNINSYLQNNIVTKKEFDENFIFLTRNWEKLSGELSSYFEMKALQELLLKTN